MIAVMLLDESSHTTRGKGGPTGGLNGVRLAICHCSPRTIVKCGPDPFHFYERVTTMSHLIVPKRRSVVSVRLA